jgi:hypothetical protein
MDFVKLISYLFHSRTQTHIFHLQTQSFAEHMALNAYYDVIVPLIDGIVEAYQGKYGIVKGYTNFNLMEYNNTQQVISYLEALCNAVYSTYETIEDSYILNLLDGITELIKSTIYKLQNSYLTNNQSRNPEIQKTRKPENQKTRKL